MTRSALIEYENIHPRMLDVPGFTVFDLRESELRACNISQALAGRPTMYTTTVSML
jgi:hypothetical protein